MSRERLDSAGSLAGMLVAIAVSAAGAQGCLERRADDTTPERGRCASCHGSASRTGSELERAAPPIDLAGKTDPSRPGVGAHERHLVASATHGPVACDQCHQVPDAVDSPGHADSNLPAEIVLGALAHQGGRSPKYDPEQRTCSGSYCHRDSAPRWTAQRSAEETCGSCHGLPPAAPHPQANDCSKCHGDVIDESRHFIAPELHVNGMVNVKGLECNSCHGSPQSNAPPPDLAGNVDRSSIGVGAHEAHLAGGAASRPVACSDCHQLPAAVGDPGHIDSTPNAELTFSGVATANGASAAWDHESRICAGSWCHGPSAPALSQSPLWTGLEGALGCTDCHGTPPAAPHPQISRCALCHSAVVASDNQTILERALHVNGMIDVLLPTACNACHGNANNPAPPSDLAGNILTVAPGVGAHQAHLGPSSVARRVECAECHVVPATVTASGHMDSPLPAELVFSGVAVTNGAQPAWNGKSCTNTYCHGVSTPEWTAGAEQAVCGSCHGLPPPPPHFQSSLACSACHTNMTAGFGFINPALHVDGVVQ